MRHQIGSKSRTLTYDTLIVGAGVAGLSAAFALARRGASVALADGGHAGQSSWAGAGIVCPLMPWDYSEEMNQLALAGMAEWPAFAAALREKSGLDPEYWVCGMEVLSGSSPFSENPFELALDWCQKHDFYAEKQAGQRLWLPKVAQVRNPRLIAALSASIDALGGPILQNCKITGLKNQGRKVVSVLSDTHEFQAETFVLAAGAWSGLPMGSLAPPPHIRPIRGQMLLYAPGNHGLTHILYRNGVYLVPRKDGHLLAGSTLEETGFDASTTADALAHLQQAACDLLPTLRGQSPIRSWSGLRPGSPDNIPLIDRHPDFDNVWIHTGHFRYGVTMAPSSSRLLTELMLDEKPSIDPTPYSWQAALARNCPSSQSC